MSEKAPLRGRVLGIDYGARRIGLALSDEMRMIAQALQTLERRRDADASLYHQLLEIIDHHEVTHIVVGWPLRLNGREGIQTQKVERFILGLTDHTPLEITRWDERLTTISAERVLREGGVKGAQRRAKIDQVAAAVILQSWLDTLNSTQL